MRLSLLSAAALAAFAGAANAQITLTEWVLFGETGDQVSTAATNNAAGVTGDLMARGAGITPTAAGNSISASGWNDLAADDYFTFGFTVDSGSSVDLDELWIATRSSNTGPGFLGLRYSGDGFASDIASIVNTGTFFTNSVIDLSTLTGLTGTVEFRIYAQNNVSANGGTIGSSGTLRISEYFDGANYYPVYFTGTVNSGGGFATAFCNGDGSGALCPCGNQNDGSTGISGCANSAGAGGGKLGYTGSNSIGAADLVLTGSGLTPGQPGLYLQGLNAINGGLGNPFGDGLRCVGGGIVRLQVRTANASGLSNTTINVSSVGGVNPGDLRRYQLWYRDPVGPCGGGFNFTNGLEINTWIP